MNTRTDVTKQIKNGDKVILVDGFYDQYGKVYGIKEGNIRIKIEHDGIVEWSWAYRIYQSDNHHQIGVYKI